MEKSLSNPGGHPVEGDLLRIADGYDYSLPSHVRPTPNTGWAGANPALIERWEALWPPLDSEASTIGFHRSIAFNWSEINPERGRYDWKIVDEAIEDVSRVPRVAFSLMPAIWCKNSRHTGRHQYGYGGYGDHGHGAWPRPKEGYSFPYEMIPGWVKVKYLSTGLPAAWDPDPANEYMARLKDFIHALAERYAEHERFGWIYVGCMDFAFGEGQLRPPWDASAGEIESYFQSALAAGLSPEAYTRFLHGLVDIFAEAFRGREGQVVWTNHEDDDSVLGRYGGAEYSERKRRSWEYAVERGLGGRDGQVEVWMRYTTKGYGNSIDADGYLVMDEDFAPIRDGRLWYTENENWTSHFVPDAERLPYIGQTRGLRLLQMRRNWDWGGLSHYESDPAFGRYMQLSFGKTPADSPDAWCLLRQGFAGRGANPVSSRNFERWLFQREVEPDGRTRDAWPFDLSGLHQLSQESIEYGARKTDSAAGQDCLYFRVEDRWIGDGRLAAPMRLFVSYLDDEPCIWQVEYSTPEGMRRSPAVEQKGEAGATLRTAVFELPRFRAGGAFAGGMDFRLRRIAGGDLTARFARLVRWGRQ